MSFTKTQEQKQERWARIAELEVSKRVMTSAQSISARNKQKKATILADKAENLLNSLTQSVRVSKALMGTNPLTVEDKAPVPDANTFLPNRKKIDQLAVKANQIIDDILKG
jgi:HSP90 family molecular chaperone